jgi:hypothetical protein
MDKFEQMVETLEEAEDTVECKECFDLFPKAECEKHEMGGYICPTCKGAMTKEFKPDSRDITFDLYDHDFPEVADYDDRFESEPRTERDLASAFDALVKDEYEAIGAYDAVADVVDETVFDDAKQKKSTMKALKHIRDEEEEHIEELRDIADGDVDEEELEELFSGASSKPGNNSTVAPMLASADAEEPVDAEPLKESTNKWVCFLNGKDIGTVEADTEEAAIEKMMVDYPNSYNNEDFSVEPIVEEAKAETLVEGPITDKIANSKFGKFVKGVFGKDHAKNLARVFNNGYVIFVQVPEGREVPEQHGMTFDATKYDLVLKTAKAVSSQIKGSVVWVYALKPDMSDLGQAVKAVVDYNPAKKLITNKAKNKSVEVASLIAKCKGGSISLDNTAAIEEKLKKALENDKTFNDARNQSNDDSAPSGDPTADTDDTAPVEDEGDLSELDTEDDTTVEDEVAAADSTSTETETETSDTSTETTETETTSTEGETKDDKPAKGSKEDNKKWHGHEVSNKTINAFRKLMRTMNLEVYDAMGTKVGTDIPSLRKINAETLLDYEVVINGKKVAVATWLKDMVKNGIITESFVVDLYGKDLYESFDDSYDAFDDFDDEFEDDTIVVCTWCGQDFPKEECKLERDMGYLCQFCEEAIKSRGEELIFID